MPDLVPQLIFSGFFLQCVVALRSPLFSTLSRLTVGVLLAISTTHAQDRLIFKDKHVQEGKVTGMNGNTVMITLQSGAGAGGSLAFDLGLLDRVDVPAPPAFQTGSAAYSTGDWDKALAAIKPLADQFRGLPTEWARQAAGMLGDLYVEKNDLTRAETAYNDFRKFYPATGNSVRYSLGQARIAFGRNNPASAKKQLDPIAQTALKDPASASRQDGAAYGQTFYLLGQMAEKQGNHQEALEDYLRTVTLFYQDNATATRAQTEANALRAAHKDLVAP